VTYSRKGRWLAVGVLLLLTGTWIAVVRLGHWTMMERGMAAIPLVIIVGALGFRAFFFQDEIQRQARMREWYFGGTIGLLATGILMVCIRMFPAILLSLWHSRRTHILSADQCLIIGLVIGYVLTVAMQVIGALLARVITFVRFRT
jgi:hypothetical protein